MLDVTFRNRLLNARKNLGLTQAQVADRLGITQPTYAGIEKGKHSASLTTVQRIADVLGVPTDELVSEAENKLAAAG